MSSGSTSRRGVGADDVVAWFKTYYAHLTLALLMLFMFWIRIRPMDRFTGTDPLQWQAVDSYYHWRTTEYTVRNFPFTMPFEVFTGFPTGRYVGQFGTLFDQFIAAIALVIGLGSAGDSEIMLAGLIGVPLIATAVAIPVYLLGKRLGGTVGALASVAILALSSGEFLSRSIAGMFQHHAAEVLMMALSVLALYVALGVARREQPVWELVLDRDFGALKRPFVYSALAGFAMGTYMWVWPPGVVLIGIVGVFFAVAILIDHVRGVSPEPVVFVGIVSMVIPALMMGLLLEEWSTSVTSFGYLQPAAAGLVAVGAAFMGVLSRVWYARDYDPLSYPAAIGAVGLVAIVGMLLVLPDLFSTMFDNFTRRLLPIDPAVTDATISEARPPDNAPEFFFEQFGFAFYTMLVGLAALAARPFLGRTYRVEHTLVIVWTVFLISMALTQIRFSYYLVLAIAVVNAYVVKLVVEFVDLPSLESVRSIKGYQALTVVLLIVVLFIPLLGPVAPISAMETSDNAFPSGDAQSWTPANEFLADNTPEPGDWGDHSNADDLDYWDTYAHPENGHDYPDGAYGVMSWWDYGHLITTHGERIPHANPFQQNARSAAHYLLSTDEEQANLVLDAIEASGGGVSTHDVDELREIIDDHDEELTTDFRYVMVDDQMAALNPGKMQAIAQWTDIPVEDLYETREFESAEPFSALQALQAGIPVTEAAINDTTEAPGVSELYEETMINRLYFEDTDGLEHYRIVHETEQTTPFGSVDGDVTLINTRLHAFVDAIGTTPIQWAAATEDELYDVRQEPTVKTFERVEGATLTGSVDDPEQSVVVEVDVTTNTDREFVYRTVVEPEADGTFEATIPYASDYDLDVEDGYTEPAVETGDHVHVAAVDDLDEADLDGLADDERVADALGDRVTHIDRVSVAESEVYDGDEVPVDLTERPAFAIEDVTVPDDVTANESTNVTATITNEGAVADRQPVTLSEDESVVDETLLELEAGESIEVDLEITFDEAGEATVVVETIADSYELTVTVADDGDDADAIGPIIGP